MPRTDVVDAYRAPLVPRESLEHGTLGLPAPVTERDLARVERFCAVPDGSFVWTRLDDGHHLGRLGGPCRKGDRVRACDWLGVAVDPALVPEQVAYAFSRGGRNFQRIGLPGAGDATARVWDLLA